VYTYCAAVTAGEALVVMQLLSGLLAAGVPGGDIGIISPYKAQVRTC
jgi:superfamily I DNA and/or RNA helicase